MPTSRTALLFCSSVWVGWSFVANLAMAQSVVPTPYDGLWQVVWRCDANVLNGAGAFVERFQVRIEQNRFSRVTEGTSPQGRAWRQDWEGRVEGRAVTIIANGSEVTGARWQYRQSGEFLNPSAASLTGGNFGVGTDTRQFRSCNAEMSMLEPSPSSIFGAERRRQQEQAERERQAQQQRQRQAEEQRQPAPAAQRQAAMPSAQAPSPPSGSAEPATSAVPPGTREAVTAPPSPQSSQTAVSPRPGERATQALLVEGVGSTIESAVQNAAENALRQVVGSFISADTQVQRRTQIADGIREQSRTITRQMREYSQGSIQTFEVIESRQDGALFRVSARAVVRIDDFRVYMQRVVEGSVDINQGLFGQAAAQQRNETDRSLLLLERVAMPLVQGQGISFHVRPPVELTQENRPCAIAGPRNTGDASLNDLRDGKNFICPEILERAFRNLENTLDGKYYIFPVDITFDRNIATNIFNTSLAIGGAEIVRPNQIQIRRNSLSDDLAVMGFIFPAGERLARDGRDIARVARRAGAANRIEYTQIEFIVDDNWRRFANTLNRGQIRFEIQESDGSLLFDRNFYAGGRRDCAKEESALCSRGVRPPSGIIHGFRPFIQRQADSRGVRWAFYLDVDYRFYIIARLPTEVLARARRAVVRYEPGL